jgi:chaperone modulatory protein CbpM
MPDSTRPSRAAVVEDELQLSLTELSRSCGCSVEWLIELVHEGVLEPQGGAPAEWRFTGVSLRRARVAWHLARDLELNAPGVALALDLLDEIHALKVKARFGGL